jgi:hypothetical protein
MASSDRIILIVKAIQDANVPNKDAYFSSKYAQFKTKYPMLYEMACKEEKVDMTNLGFMLSMLDKMTHENVTQYDASASVGQMLYDKYIHDEIKDLPPTKK